MDLEFIYQRFPFLKKHFISIVLGFFGLILIGYGLIISIFPKQARENITFHESAVATGSAVLKPKEIQVDVEGSVARPGVYSLNLDARTRDALIAAGGLSQEADRDYLAKHINLAAKIPDGGKLYIPRIGEAVQGASTVSDANTIQGDGQSSSVNINSASAQDLDALPGIGTVTAQKIISNRPYGDINELTTKKVVSTKVFGLIKDKISL